MAGTAPKERTRSIKAKRLAWATQTEPQFDAKTRQLVAAARTPEQRAAIEERRAAEKVKLLTAQAKFADQQVQRAESKAKRAEFKEKEARVKAEMAVAAQNKIIAAATIAVPAALALGGFHGCPSPAEYALLMYALGRLFDRNTVENDGVYTIPLDYTVNDGTCADSKRWAERAARKMSERRYDRKLTFTGVDGVEHTVLPVHSAKVVSRKGKRSLVIMPDEHVAALVRDAVERDFQGVQYCRVAVGTLASMPLSSARLYCWAAMHRGRYVPFFNVGIDEARKLLCLAPDAKAADVAYVIGRAVLLHMPSTLNLQSSAQTKGTLAVSNYEFQLVHPGLDIRYLASTAYLPEIKIEGRDRTPYFKESIERQIERYYALKRRHRGVLWFADYLQSWRAPDTDGGPVAGGLLPRSYSKAKTDAEREAILRAEMQRFEKVLEERKDEWMAGKVFRHKHRRSELIVGPTGRSKEVYLDERQWKVATVSRVAATVDRPNRKAQDLKVRVKRKMALAEKDKPPQLDLVGGVYSGPGPRPLPPDEKQQRPVGHQIPLLLPISTEVADEVMVRALVLSIDGVPPLRESDFLYPRHRNLYFEARAERVKEIQEAEEADFYRRTGEFAR